MARTTIDLDPSVLAELRDRSRREGKSMGQVASEILARALRTDQPAAAPAFGWVTAYLGLPQVDLEDKEAVWAVLDGSR